MSHERHPFCNRFTQFLTDIMRNQAPSAPAVAALPLFTFEHPAVDVGRKNRGRSGSRLLLPLRISWGDEDVKFITRSQTLSYTAIGAGYSLKGEISFEMEPGVWEYKIVDGTLSSGKPVVTKNQLEPVDAIQARWDAASAITPYVLRSVKIKQSNLAYEFAEFGVDLRAEFQPIDIRIIADKLILGEKGHTSPVFRIIDHLCSPTAFAACDPQRKICTTLKRDCEFMVRKHYGDDRCGRRIREVYRRTNPKTVQELVEHMSIAHPNDNACSKKVKRALEAVGVQLA